MSKWTIGRNFVKRCTHIQYSTERMMLSEPATVRVHIHTEWMVVSEPATVGMHIQYRVDGGQ